MEKKQNVPALRFQGFSGEWKRQKFGEVATFINGRAYAQSELLSAGKYKVLRVGNFYTNSTWYYSNLELSDKYYANRGDLLYTWSATFGPHIWDGDKVIYHYHIWKIEVKEQLEKLFFLQLLERDKKNLLNDTNGSTMVHITKLGMENKTDFIPNNIDEQSKIGQFCSQINCKIEKEKRKIQKLQQFRQAMLTKLFPREGAAEPELRFRGFSGKWKSCCLTDIATINPPGELPETFNYVDLESVIGTEIVKYRRETKFSAPSRAQRVAEDNDVFYQMVRPYQKNNCIFRGNDKTFVFSTGYAQLRPNCNSYFLLSLLQTEYFVGKVMELCTGTSFPAISASDLARIPIYVPVMSEENGAIGEYFQNLDSYISLQQKKLERMQRLKAALLEKLFV